MQMVWVTEEKQSVHLYFCYLSIDFGVFEAADCLMMSSFIINRYLYLGLANLYNLIKNKTMLFEN